MTTRAYKQVKVVELPATPARPMTSQPAPTVPAPKAAPAKNDFTITPVAPGGENIPTRNNQR